MLVQINILEYLIEKGPGRTERQLAEAIHGSSAVQQAVNQDCRRLAEMGKVKRVGAGGVEDPYRYYPLN